MAESNTIKVFVGNLSFNTTDEGLAEAFKNCGKIVSSNIITRGRNKRSLGYGFLEFETIAAANAAVAAMNKKELDGRPINVEVARPRPEGEENNNNNNSGNKRAPRNRGPRKNNAEGDAPAAERKQRAPRNTDRVPQENKTPSKTTLFVANLPFSVDNDGLKKIYEGLKAKDQHVILRRNGRSKGYGFVEFGSESDQLAALKATDGKEVEGRPLIVKAANAEFKEINKNNSDE